MAGGNDFDHLRDHVAWIEAALLVADQAIGHAAHHVALGEVGKNASSSQRKAFSAIASLKPVR